jgi:hypothetical protein
MTHLPHLSTAPQRRRFRALDALDRLVARECEAVTVGGRPPDRTAAAAEAPTDADAAGDDAFIQGAVAYLSTRPNAAELIAGIERGWQDVRAERDEPPPADADHGEEAAPGSAASDAVAGPAAGARPESAP